MREHERHILCGAIHQTRGAGAGSLYIDVDAPRDSPSRVNLEIGDLSRRLADRIPDELTDLLEIAAYIYCADQFTKRGSRQMTKMGADWRRRFRFHIPVRRPALWNMPEIEEALRETLEFLSEDEFSFDFSQAANPRPLQSYLPFGESGAQHLDDVILFSGGLDSLAGAVNLLFGERSHVALVSHQSSKMIASKQNRLVQELRERTPPGSLIYVPVSVNKGSEDATEFTQRTRSMLFASLGLVVARMLGLDRLRFYENGVVSINLPIVEHVIGSRASRTTHPRFLSDCSRLFSLLLSADFKIENPYALKTKAEVVRILTDRDQGDFISKSMSCTRIREVTQTGKHCGVCSQCVDRRISILAAGAGAYESSGNYLVDLFTGAQSPGPDLAMIESYVVRGQRLSTMSRQAFLATYGQIYRAAAHFQGSSDDVLTNIWDLHRRHGAEVVSVVDAEIAKAASLAGLSSLPLNSLLAMVMSPLVAQRPYLEPTETTSSAADQASEDQFDYHAGPIRLVLDQDHEKIVFDDKIILSGGAYKLIASLAKDFETDLSAGASPEQYRYVHSKTLAQRLRISEASLRMKVMRARKNIAHAFGQQFDRIIDPHDVIETRGWKGYRLSPHLAFVRRA